MSHLKNKGISLKNLKKFLEAIQCFNKAIKIDPNNQTALNNRKETEGLLEKTN